MATLLAKLEAFIRKPTLSSGLACFNAAYEWKVMENKIRTSKCNKLGRKGGLFVQIPLGIPMSEDRCAPFFQEWGLGMRFQKMTDLSRPAISQTPSI